VTFEQPKARESMLTQIHPKLPMRDAQRTKAYYVDTLGFDLLGDYGDYLFDSKTI